MILDDLFEDLVHLRALALDVLLRALHRLGDSLLHQLVDDERLEELERHRLRQSALMQAELRADDDDRATRVVHALAEQVLTEPALLALEHVAERLERTLAATPNRLRATAVVEQRVDRFLEHALLVPENDLRRAMHDELLQTVVAVDDAAVQIVEVRRREPSTVEWHERTQVGRNDWNDIQDHPLRLVARVARLARVAERVDDLEPLQHLLLAMLRRLRLHVLTELVGDLVHVESTQELAHRRRSNIRPEGVVVRLARLRAQVEVFVLVEQLQRTHFLLARLDDDVVRVVDDLLEITKGEIEEVAHRTGQGLEEPDVGDGHRELDVTHALATHLRQRHLDAAAIANHATVPDALVLPAMALPVLHRTEDALAEEAILLGLERAVVDGLGLRDLAPRPPVPPAAHLDPLALLGILGPTDLLGRRDANLNEIEIRAARLARATEVNHLLLPPTVAIAEGTAITIGRA